METKNDFKQVVQVLVHIQELDLKIAVLKKEKESLISKLSELDGSIQSIQQSYQTQSNAIDGLEREREQLVGFRETNRRRLAEVSVAMTESRSQEAFQAKRKEIEELQQFENLLVEREQKYGKEIEAATKDIEPLFIKLNMLTEERNARASDLSRKAGEVNADIVSLLAEKKLFSSQVTPHTLAQYERVRLTKGGDAVVSVTKGMCHGCNMFMPSQFYSELLKAAEMQFCPRCHRIVYYSQ